MDDDKLKVLMLSWEFPPRIVGGIAAHVHGLSRALSRAGVNVHVVTCDFPGAKDYEEVDGVHVHRFDSYKIPALDFLAWIFMMNSNMIQCAVNVINSQDGYFDLIHAHDWLVARAALELKNCYRKPLISTIHATEAGRRKGIRNGYQKSIHNIESQLIHQSDGIICCSDYMAKQVCQLFNLPPEKVEIIYNGIDVSKFNFKVDSEKIKEKFAQRDEKIVLYVGRLVHEKGVHVLIGAVPKVLSQIPEAKFIIVGEGGMKESLMEEARYFNVDDKVLFTGFIDDETLKNLYKVSDVVVCPSLYEPFGIVALEAMAARTPVVVSDVGGLSEIVEHDKTGVKVYADNSDSLAWGILRVLKHPAYAERLRHYAYKKILQCYNWDSIAYKTLDAYKKVLSKVSLAEMSTLDLEFNLTKGKRLSMELRLLTILYAQGAVTEKKSITVDEIANLLRTSKKNVLSLIGKLFKENYLAKYVDVMGKAKYYLSKKGIIKVCSIFS